AALTAQQPLNNIARVTIQALAAVLGGTQSLHTNSFDEAHGLPTEESVTVALRTQQIIAEESGVANIVDPLAGSVWVEHLTDAILDGARLIIEDIDNLGGAVRAIEEGYPQRMIHNSAWEMLNELESGARKVIGVNHSVMDETTGPSPQAIDSTIADKQMHHIKEIFDSRNAELVNKSLDEVERTCRAEEEQIMPAVLKAVRARATIGEITGRMRNVWGDYEPPAGL
ncbi:MAG TPA: methylmalonyl-CoA mutase family protein, partial [Candidatus Poseidoniales archaeon]|nr:methylmalonyl-CoA mutase family protein [Candidatus Poseidoniales archaeon]